MPIYISVVTRAIDLPIHLHIVQEHAFNDSIQCSEDYPLMYEGDSHRWYLKLSYLDRMPNSIIPHQTTVMMMRIYRIFFSWKAVYTYGAGWSVQITAFKSGAEKQRVRGRTSSLFYGINLDEKWHIFSNLSMDRAEGISWLQYLEMLHTWAYLWEKKIMCKENVVAHRKSIPAC